MYKRHWIRIHTGMTMQPQITSRVKSALFHLRNIRRIRKFLNPQATKNLVHAFITSGLDMFNFTLTGLPQQQVQRVQKMQNSAARLVTRAPRSAHITPFLLNLHWLPIKQRVEFKLLVLTYKAIHGLSPTYIAELVEIRVPGRSGLRSSSTLMLLEKRSRRSWGDECL